MPPPRMTEAAVPAVIAALTSFASGVVAPSSAMSSMPWLAVWPAFQNETDALCVPPTSGDQCGFGGNPVGCVAWLHAAVKVIVYCAVGVAAPAGRGAPDSRTAIAAVSNLDFGGIDTPGPLGLRSIRDPSRCVTGRNAGGAVHARYVTARTLSRRSSPVRYR